MEEYYSLGKIKFEGEYLKNKKWNGKGYDIFGHKIYELKNGRGFVTEYNEFYGLIYKSEYLNGEKNGKARTYWCDKLLFEGEYLNGKFDGKGKEYDKSGILRFEGEYLYNYKLKGKLYIKGALEYEGEFLYDKKWNGKGYDENGNIIYELINGNGKVR